MPDRGELEVAVRISPLTALVRGLLERVMSREVLDDLFARHVADQRVRQVTAGAVTHLMLQVVAGTHRAVFAAFQADQSSDEPLITTSYQALYERLGRMFPQYSCALVRASSRQFGDLVRAQHSKAVGCWKSYALRMVDGTMPEGSEHRLGVLRECGPAGLPAKVVFAFDPDSRLCVDVEASEDAYTSEARLAGELFSRARRGELYVADRAYCSSTLFALLIDQQADFVIREMSGPVIRNTSRLTRVGDLDGGRVLEQTVVMTQPRTGREMALRRIVFRLAEPTQKGETEVRLLTMLPDSINAVEIANLYGRRWTIETHIDRVKHILQGEIQSLGKPRAAIFVLCLSMVASNALAAAETQIRKAHRTTEELSGYYLADEIAAHYRSLSRIVSAQTWLELSDLPVPDFQAWCRRVARDVRPQAFTKHPRGPKHPPPKRTSGKHRHHFSTHRLLNAAKENP